MLACPGEPGSVHIVGASLHEAQEAGTGIYVEIIAFTGSRPNNAGGWRISDMLPRGANARPCAMKMRLAGRRVIPTLSTDYRKLSALFRALQREKHARSRKIFINFNW